MRVAELDIEGFRRYVDSNPPILENVRTVIFVLKSATLGEDAWDILASERQNKYSQNVYVGVKDILKSYGRKNSIQMPVHMKRRASLEDTVVPFDALDDGSGAL